MAKHRLDRAMETMFQALHRHLYSAVFLSLFLETAGLPLPGELILLTAGALVAPALTRVTGIILGGTLGAVVGDLPLFLLGRRLSEDRKRRLVGLYCRWTYCTQASRHCQDRARGLIRRFDARALILGKFVFGVRQFMAPVAGMAQVSPVRFIGYDAAGSALWTAAVSLLGFYLQGEVAFVIRLLGHFKAVAVLALLTVAVVFVPRVAQNSARLRASGVYPDEK